MTAQPLVPVCAPDPDTALLVGRTPAVIAYGCLCGDPQHSYTATAYEAAALHLPNSMFALRQPPRAAA